MDKLATLDAGFIEAEDSDQRVSLAIGGLAILEGPIPDREAQLSISGPARDLRSDCGSGRSTGPHPNGSTTPTSTLPTTCGGSRSRPQAATVNCSNWSPR